MKKFLIIVLLFISGFLQAQDTRTVTIRPTKSWLVDSLLAGRYNVSLFTDYGYKILVNNSKKFEIGPTGIFNYYSGIHNFTNGGNVEFGTTDNYSLKLKTADTTRLEITNLGNIILKDQVLGSDSNYSPGFALYKGSYTFIRMGNPAMYSGGSTISSTTANIKYPYKNTSIFIGEDAGGNANVFNAIGSSFLGNHNIGIGYATLKQITTGYYNFAAGLSALTTVTTGTNNFGLGHFNQSKVTTGSYNTTVGNNAMQYSGSASYGNVYVGGASGQSYSLTAPYTQNTASQYINIGIGFFALRYVTSGLRNIAIGTNGLHEVTTGKGNIQIGGSSSNSYGTAFSPGRGITTGSNNILIGDTLWTSSQTVSNELNIQRTVYGTGVGIDTARIGIMESVPTSTFDINGSITFRDTTYTGVTYSLNKKDYLLVMTYNSGNDTVVVPTASGINGREYVIKNSNERFSYIRTSNSESIDNYSSNAIALATNECLTIMSIGTGWIIKSWYKP